MSHHYILSGDRAAYGRLLCAALGSIALYLAPVSVSAQLPQVADIRCSDNTTEERTKFKELVEHLSTKSTAKLRQIITDSPNIVIDCHGTNGFNALHYAATYVDTEGVKILVEAGADRRKLSDVVSTISPCPETPYGVALALNRLGTGELRPPAMIEALDYDPRNVPWITGGSSGSATGGSDDDVGATGDSDDDVGATAGTDDDVGATAGSDDDAGGTTESGVVATSDTCQVRHNEIKRWMVGRTTH